jgi:hypothetical protein
MKAIGRTAKLQMLAVALVTVLFPATSKGQTNRLEEERRQMRDWDQMVRVRRDLEHRPRPPRPRTGPTAGGRNRQPQPDREQSKAEVRSDSGFFAPNLKAHLRLVRTGTVSGAQLTRDPAPDAGVSNIWIGNTRVFLERGDIIYSLDSLPVLNSDDVLRHYSRTVITFIDHRTGRAFVGVTNLPPYPAVPADATSAGPTEAGSLPPSDNLSPSPH